MTLHATIAKAGTRVVADGGSQATAVQRSERSRVGKAVVRGDTLSGSVLQEVVVQLNVVTTVGLAKRVLSERVQSILRAIDIHRHGRVHALANVTSSMGIDGERGAHTHQGVMAVVSTVVIQLLFPLQLVLDALAVWRVSNERKNGTNALDKQCPLSRLGIVQSGLEGIRNLLKRAVIIIPGHSSCHRSRATIFRAWCGSKAPQ